MNSTIEFVSKLREQADKIDEQIRRQIEDEVDRQIEEYKQKLFAEHVGKLVTEWLRSKLLYNNDSNAQVGKMFRELWISYTEKYRKGEKIEL